MQCGFEGHIPPSPCGLHLNLQVRHGTPTTQRSLVGSDGRVASAGDRERPRSVHTAGNSAASLWRTLPIIIERQNNSQPAVTSQSSAFRLQPLRLLPRQSTKVGVRVHKRGASCRPVFSFYFDQLVQLRDGDHAGRDIKLNFRCRRASCKHLQHTKIKTTTPTAM